MRESEILLNQVFAGKYGFEGENIVHENINLFKSDDDFYYLYAPYTGDIGSHRVGKVAFVLNVDKRRTVEVIAMSDDLESVDKSEWEKVTQEIRYEGSSLDDIFCNNVYGSTDDKGLTRITFKTKTLKRPKKGTRVFITLDDRDSLGLEFGNDDHVITLNLPDRKQFFSENMRFYCSPEDKPEAYEKLQRELFGSEFLWRELDSRYGSDKMTQSEAPTFLKIIKKEDDELVFSNLLAYYLEIYPKGLERFIDEVLNDDTRPRIKGFDANHCRIIRESKYNIDLWIQDCSHVIVIENKIKSGINGITGPGKNQLAKYCDKTRQYIEDKGLDIEPRFFVFAPNYNNLELKLYDDENAYKMVRYSDIYEFFRKHAAEYKNICDEKHFSDFLQGLRRHTLTASELYFETMTERFRKRLE